MIEHRIARVNGIDVSHYVAGEGDPVILLHGMAETAWSCWSEQIKPLAEQYRVYAIDMRGHGRTGTAGSDGTLEQLSADLNAFVDDITGPAAFIGFSMGGTIGLHAAAQPSTQLTRVVTMGGSSIIGRPTADFFRAKAQTVEERDVPGLHAQMRKDIDGMFVQSPEKSADYAEWRIAAVGEGEGYANAGLAMARMRDVPLQPELAKVTIPIDVVGGEKDVWCPKRASDVIIEGLVNAPVKYTEIPRVGHLMSVDDPQGVADALLAILASVPTYDESAA